MFTSPKMHLSKLLSRRLSIMALAGALSVATGADARAKKLPEPQQRDLVEFVAGNMLFVGFHEMGHALVSQLGLPVLGRGEDAADSFATLAMLEEGTDFSINVLVQAARGWFLMDRRDRKLGNTPSFYDAHGLDKQRAYAIVCLMVGSNNDQFRELADWVQMPQVRQQTCQDDYNNAKSSWDQVLKPFLLAADRAKSNIDVVYESGPANLDPYVRSFRSVRFLETLAEHTSGRYVLPRPITLQMKSCGDSIAWWDPPALKETLCYEMADDFAELYQGFTKKRAAMQNKANALVAQNVKRIHVQREVAGRTAHQLENLGRALTLETEAFLAQASRKEAAVKASPLPETRVAAWRDRKGKALGKSHADSGYRVLLSSTRAEQRS